MSAKVGRGPLKNKYCNMKQEHNYSNLRKNLKLQLKVYILWYSFMVSLAKLKTILRLQKLMFHDIRIRPTKTLQIEGVRNKTVSTKWKRTIPEWITLKSDV